MQYRVEVMSQMNYEEVPSVVCRGNILRSRDVAGVVLNGREETYKGMVTLGFVQYFKLRLMERPWYFCKWTELESVSMTKDGDCDVEGEEEGKEGSKEQSKGSKG